MDNNNSNNKNNLRLTLNDKGEQLCGKLISDRQTRHLNVRLELQEKLVPKRRKKGGNERALQTRSSIMTKSFIKLTSLPPQAAYKGQKRRNERQSKR